MNAVSLYANHNNPEASFCRTWLVCEDIHQVRCSTIVGKFFRYCENGHAVLIGSTHLITSLTQKTCQNLPLSQAVTSPKMNVQILVLFGITREPLKSVLRVSRSWLTGISFREVHKNYSRVLHAWCGCPSQTIFTFQKPASWTISRYLRGQLGVGRSGNGGKSCTSMHSGFKTHWNKFWGISVRAYCGRFP